MRRYNRREFGNASPTWDSLAEFLAGKERTGLFHIRNRVAGGPTWYNLTPKQVKDTWIKLLKKGTDPKSLYISAMAPHHRGTIQGEIKQCAEHIDLRYNTQKLPMREGFKVEDLRIKGLAAIHMLRRYLDAASYDWVQQLLEDYPGHIIEFSAFEIPWGTLPTRNTVIWEVRPDREVGSNLSEFTELY